jgi:hypothetical protein
MSDSTLANNTPSRVVTAPSCGCLVLEDEWCRRCGGCLDRSFEEDDDVIGCCTCTGPDERTAEYDRPLSDRSIVVQRAA